MLALIKKKEGGPKIVGGDYGGKPKREGGMGKKKPPKNFFQKPREKVKNPPAILGLQGGGGGDNWAFKEKKTQPPNKGGPKIFWIFGAKGPRFFFRGGF